MARSVAALEQVLLKAIMVATVIAHAVEPTVWSAAVSTAIAAVVWIIIEERCDGEET